MKSFVFLAAMFSVLLAVIVFMSFIFYNQYLAEKVVLAPVVNDGGADEPILYSPEDILFYDNIRFLNLLVSYSIDGGCDETRYDDAKTAFKILGDNTVLDFYEKPEGEILVLCSDKEKELPDEHFVIGEGGPNAILNTGKYAVILNGTVYLYRESECDEPVVAMHEILHVIGFNHSQDENSIMYKVSNCKQEIDNTIIEKIKELYEDPVLPDMIFKNINATKKGVYIDLSAEVVNEGLAKSDNVFIKIYSEDKEIKSYNLGGFGSGAGKVINVDNLRIPYLSQNIILIIDPDNKIEEINKTNNKIELKIE